MLDLSIIILSYKSKEHLKVLLPSIWASEGVEFTSSNNVVQAPGLPQAFEQGKALHYIAELIIVDNGSNDGTIEWLENETSYKNRTYGGSKWVRLVKNKNTGFASGNNLGIKQVSGRYILLLNPDTKVEPDTFKAMLDFMESRPDVGISGCKIIKPDGKLDLACRRRFPNPRNSFKRLFLLDNTNYNYSDISENQEMEVDSVVGAFMLIRKSLIDRIGLLDESFFMYGEDLDYCWRCKEAGFKVWYYPKTFIWHYKGASSAKIPFKSLRWFHQAMWIFYQKHYEEDYPIFFTWLVFLAIYIRLGILMFINLFKSQPVVSR